MTEEEVTQEFAKMNQDIYIKKLLIDLDQCYELLTIIFGNVINIFYKEMDTRTYEISFMDEKSLSHDEISIKIKEFFDKIKESIDQQIKKNKETLKGYITNNDIVSYMENIEVLSIDLKVLIDDLFEGV